MKYKMAIILGTRPEAIKLTPIYLALKTTRLFEPVIISTGQHATNPYCDGATSRKISNYLETHGI